MHLKAKKKERRILSTRIEKMSLNSISRDIGAVNADEEEATAPEHNIFHYHAGCYCLLSLTKPHCDECLFDVRKKIKMKKITNKQKLSVKIINYIATVKRVRSLTRRDERNCTCLIVFCIFADIPPQGRGRCS